MDILPEYRLTAGNASDERAVQTRLDYPFHTQ